MKPLENGKIIGELPIPAGMFGPNVVAFITEGDCLEPLIKDGERVIVDPDAEVAMNDICVFYFRDGKPQVKQLLSNIPSMMMPPFHPDDGVRPLIVIGMLNPKKQGVVDTDKLQLIHKVVGVHDGHNARKLP